MHMSDEFQFGFDWLTKDRGPQEERVTFADLTIIVGGRKATDVEDSLSRTVRGSIRASAYALAEWLVTNWWRLRWEPERSSLDWRLSHEMNAISGGYIWPHLVFCGDGREMGVAVHATESNRTQPIRYLRSFGTSFPMELFESEVVRFVEAVEERLNAHGVEVDGFRQLLRAWRDEQYDPEWSAWRKLEALLGYDPDEAPEGLIEKLHESFSVWGNHAVEEVAAAFQAGAQEKLDALEYVRRRACSIIVPELGPSQNSNSLKAPHPVAPWQEAEGFAKQARAQWDLGRGPIKNRTLSDLLSYPRKNLGYRRNPTRPLGMSAGFVNGHDRQLDVFLDKPRSTSRRFHLARLVGDYLANGYGEPLLPATAARMSRQKFQRAFAQEFLCPFDQLREFMGTGDPDDDRIEDAAKYFHVSPLLITTTLVNKGVLPRDMLPETYGTGLPT